MIRKLSWRLTLLTGVGVAALISGATVVAQRGGGAPAGPQNAGSPSPLRFRYIGPPSAGRIASAVGVPGDPTTYYLGSASGGVWKSTDSGQTWAPMFDDQPVQAIGALAISESDPNQVWAGTGEAWVIRDSDIGGDGIYKSTDAGKTWKNMGLPESGRIGRVIVHPTNPNIVFVCSIGRVTGPQKEQGRLQDDRRRRDLETGARRANENTGCSGLSMDPGHPETHARRHVAGGDAHVGRTLSGGPGSGVYISHDGGDTWKRIETTAGMPRSPLGKIDVAIAPSNPQRMYALIQTANQGSLWRSEDGGASWKTVSWDRTLIGRAGYYIRLR